MIMSKNIQQKASLPKYHPFSIPPAIQLCYKHRICSQFGFVAQSDSQNSQNFCQCCNSPPRQTLKLGCQISEIYEISEPVGYFFTYIKLVTFALVVIMMITGIYTLIQIINQCSNPENEDESLCLYVDGIPVPKIHVFFKTPLIILNGVVIVALYIFSAYLIFRYAYLHQKNISDHDKPSDYSVMLSGFDHEKVQIQHLRSILEEYDVRDIIFTHKIKKYLGWLSKKSVLEARLQLYWHRKSKNIEKLQKKIKKLQDKMLHTKNKLTLGQDKQYRTDKVIVTFEQTHYKKTFVQIYGMTMSKNIYHTFCGGSPLVINDCPIYVEFLGEPNQIIWQNLQVTSKSRYLRVLVSNFLALVFLLTSFVMIVYLSKGEQDQSAVGDVLMSLIFAILIQLVNQVFSFAIDFFTKWEGRYTLTGQISIKLYKNCSAYFLNTTLLPFMLFVFDLFDPEEDDIIRNILSIFFISNLISPYVGSYCNPRYLYKLYKRRKILQQGSECLQTQIKANQTFQKIDFQLDERYALVAQLFMNCMFYAAIFPIGILITIVGMMITYWSSKWWLLNYSSMPNFSYRLGRHINIISCLFPTIYAFGYAANLYMVRKEVQFNRTYSILMAAITVPISLLFIIFGERIAKRWILNHRQSVLQQMNKRKCFISYKNLNPTTFIHDNLLVQNASPENIWSKLVSYVAAKESGINFNENYDGRRSSRVSKASLNSSIN